MNYPVFFTIFHDSKKNYNENQQKKKKNMSYSNEQTESEMLSEKGLRLKIGADNVW